MLEERCQAELERLNLAGRLRRLPDCDRNWSVDLSHNDYLGLSQDKLWQDQLHKVTKDLNFGGKASRLLGVSSPVYGEVETVFAKFKQAPAALFFASGYAANEAVITALASRHTSIFSDQLNHASIIDGMRLSVVPRDRRVVFKHNDLDDLESKLKQSTADANLIITEAIFSMDGDTAPLKAIYELAQKYRGTLIVDEAHSIGIAGPQGRGLIAAAGLAHDQIISVNTCGKALGLQGAVVCGPQWVKEYLINKGRSFIYTTAPSPLMAKALSETIASLPTWEERRTRVRKMAETLRQELQALDFDTGQSQTQIIPVMVGSDHDTLALANAIQSRGVRVLPIRPPTVAEGRLRLSIHGALSEQSSAEVVTVFKGLRR